MPDWDESYETASNAAAKGELPTLEDLREMLSDKLLEYGVFSPEDIAYAAEMHIQL